MEPWIVAASKQHGLIGRAQILRFGLTDDAIWWLLKEGGLDEALPGVYRVCGARRGWEQEMMAVCLWGGEGAVASHKSAAALWEFSGFTRGPIEVSALK